MEPTGDTSTGTIDEAVDRISSSIFGGDKMESPSETPGLEMRHEEAEPETPHEQLKAESAPLRSSEQAAPKNYDPPKSWKKEMHEHWTKLDPTVQGYFIEREEQLLNGFKQFSPLRDALNPHMEYLNRLNIQAPYAVDSLLRAHRALTEGPIEQRKAYYEQLGRNLKIIQDAAETQSQPPVDPIVKQLQEELATVKTTIADRTHREFQAVQAEVQKEVNAFASDTKSHPYFDDVATDIASFVSLGMSLQDAYDKAVWANPVTRAKEQARLLTEHEAKLKENARLSALPKKKAAGVNMKSSGDGAAPTEPVGSLEDTIRSVNRELRQRAS